MGFQNSVKHWGQLCFGERACENRAIRNYRFLEEALELVQSLDCTREEALQLVDYVYGRPKGEPVQEVGGVMVTLALLCEANNVAMMDAGEIELSRCFENIQKIRAKSAAKPKFGPLP